MADLRSYNPKGVLVAAKHKGISLGGRRYALGDAVEDDCISARLRRLLYQQNKLCHPHELDTPAPPEEVQDTSGGEGDKDTKDNSSDVNLDADNPDEDESGNADESSETEEGSEETEDESESESEDEQEEESEEEDSPRVVLE